MPATFDFPREALSSDELGILHEVLETCCEKTDTPLRSPAGEKAALELIDWFHFGINDHDKLLELVSLQLMEV